MYVCSSHVFYVLVLTVAQKTVPMFDHFKLFGLWHNAEHCNYSGKIVSDSVPFGFLITKYSFSLDENLKYNKSNKIITHWDSFLTCHSFQQYERISFFFPCTLKYVTCGSLCDL